MRRVLIPMVALLLAGGSLLVPPVRSWVRSLVHSDPPPAITPLPPEPAFGPEQTGAEPAVSPQPTQALEATLTPTATAAPSSAGPLPTVAAASATLPPPASPTRMPVIINGHSYKAYLAAATKQGQAYKYSCEFDAAWVILTTYGIEVSVDEIIAIVGHDQSIEPYIEETSDGFIIHGGDITSAFSGNYTSNFLARSTGMAMRKAFEHFGLQVTPVHDREGIERALDQGRLVWMKTTVDFNVWRPATWRTPDGATIRTVLGNDHAVVVMGYNEEVVVIRDVLGPTSSNWQRPYQYAVDWKTFLAAWEAQSFDGLAVARPGRR